MIDRSLKGYVPYAPVFIVGAPRSGSTVLYQILTQYLDVLYFDNLTVLMRENVFTALLVSHWLFRDKPHNCFESKYGDTAGLHAPAEAGQIWYRWFDRESIYADENSLNQKQQEGLRKTILSVINRFEKPILIKNLSFSQRLRSVSKLFPTATIIFIQRDPIYMAQSIFQARKKNLENINEWWSIKPKEYDKLKQRDVYDQIAGQIFYLERQIKQDIQLFSENNILTLQYEKLETDIQEILGQIRKKVNSSFRRNIDFDEIKMHLKARNTKRIADHEFDKMKSALSKYY